MSNRLNEIEEAFTLHLQPIIKMGLRTERERVRMRQYLHGLEKLSRDVRRELLLESKTITRERKEKRNNTT